MSKAKSQAAFSQLDIVMAVRYTEGKVKSPKANGR